MGNNVITESTYTVFLSLQENIRKVHEDSERLQKPVITVLRLKTAADRPAHNYSIQTFNSSELTKEWLQRQMAEVSQVLFSLISIQRLWHGLSLEQQKEYSRRELKLQCKRNARSSYQIVYTNSHFLSCQAGGSPSVRNTTVPL